MWLVAGQFIRFIVVGLLNTAVDFGLLNLLIYLFRWPSVWANTVSFSVAVLNSFFWNKYWTFRQKEGRMIQQLATFIVVSLIGLGLSDLLVYLGNVRLDYNINLVKVISVIVVFLWNFLGYKYLTFRR